MPLRQQAGLHGAADAAGTAHGVDRAHVVAMAVLDGQAGREIDAERRARERRLDVVDGERVAGEQHLDVAEPHEVAEVLRAPGVDHHRPGHERDASTALPHAAHHLGDARDDGFHPALGGDLVAHEPERGLVAGLQVRLHADALHPAHHELALPDVSQFPAADLARSSTTRAASMRWCSTTIHAAVDVNGGAMVGGGVEVLRRGAVHVGLDGGARPGRPGRSSRRRTAWPAGAGAIRSSAPAA